MSKKIMLWEELDLIKKTLSTAKKGDFLYIVHKESAAIPLNTLSLINETSAKIEFFSIPDTISEAGAMVVLGVLYAKYPDAELKIQNTKITHTLNEAFQVTEKEKKQRKPRAKKSAENTTPVPEERRETPASKKEKSVSTTKKTKPADAFEKAYDELMAFLSSCKRNKYDPTVHANAIVRAATLMVNEGTDFTTAIGYYVDKATLPKITAFFSKEEIATIKEKVGIMIKNDKK